MNIRTLLTATIFSAACALPSLAADAPATGAPPALNLSGPGVAWQGFIAPKEPNYAIARTFNDYSNPPSGLGPVTDGPAHPYANNEVAREMRIPPTYRVADLDNEAGKNLMPWAREAVQKQNELALKERNGETREARCWGTGVPAFHLNPGAMRIIQTPKEVVLFLVGRTRHIWLNVPHSRNLKPSYYGESVGHYEGDTLVVDTIGLNNQNPVDNYRTPHSEKLHVVERYRLIDEGKTLELLMTIDDADTYNQPWQAIRRYRQVKSTMAEEICAEGNFLLFDYGVPVAKTSDF